MLHLADDAGRLAALVDGRFDGRVVGTRRQGERDRLAPFEPLGQDVFAALERERADVARFRAGRPSAPSANMCS